MNRKLQNTLALVGILALILILGFAFIFFFQKSSIKKKNAELSELKAFEYDTEVLNQQLQDKKREAEVLDSVLAARKFNIPMNLSPLHFYDFINGITGYLSEDVIINIEFTEKKTDKNFFFYEYKLNGVGTFNDVYQIIYAIEQSKELKKILSINLSNFVSAEEDVEPEFLVSYALTVGVYFADNDRFTTSEYVENPLRAGRLYDIFYPLIRTNIPPNIEGLLDVQGARLLAIVPEGAFLSDIKGQSYLLIEGDRVYLGYLTQIDRKTNTVKFVLNKGGIVESVILNLEKEIQRVEK